MYEKSDATTMLELSSVQQTVWFDHMLYQGIPLYNIGLAWRIDGLVDPHLLKQSLDIVANANDALRIVLQTQDDGPRQRIVPRVDINLKICRFPGDEIGDSQARAYLQEAFSRPFDIADGSLLWEAQLVQVGQTHCYWLQRYHHLANDGFGVSIVVHAVADTYNKLLRNAAASIEPGPSYLDFLDEERRYLASTRFERDRAFWRERFTELPPPLFQPIVSQQAGQRPVGGQVRWTLARGHFDAMQTFAAAQGYTLTHLLLAALVLYFGRTQGTDEVVIGVPTHNRATARFKRTVGMFSSVNPIGVAIDQGQSFLTLLQTCATELRQCYRHQRLPISDINRAVNLTSTGRKQLFDVSLSFMSFNGDNVFGDAKTHVIPLESGYGFVPLELMVREHHAGDDVLIDFNFDSEYFQIEAVERIRSGLEHVLFDAMRRPDVPMAQLYIMDEAERRRVLIDFNDTAAPFPHDGLIHQLFEAQAARAPEAVAIVCGERQLGYGELNARANRLAHHLIALGV
ncbi:MAG: non-ribosomal peptide synthetase, partial [Burkholderiales bacterium]|nr:non-ribosomal peptide synthetase [Burkholderiales bacterium]